LPFADDYRGTIATVGGVTATYGVERVAPQWQLIVYLFGSILTSTIITYAIELPIKRRRPPQHELRPRASPAVELS
jgi:peptidoglycan/LPS O-acetylase OafA/YrhL